MVIVLTSAIIAQQQAQVTAAMRQMGFRTRVHDEEIYHALGEAFLGDVLRSGKAYADQELFAEGQTCASGASCARTRWWKVPGDVLLIARVRACSPASVARSIRRRTC